MSQDMLKKVLLAKEAGCEYQWQNLLATTWKIEELKRYLDFIEDIQAENKEQFEEASAELKLFEYLISGTSPTELRSESKRLQQLYDEELLALTTMDQLLNHLEKWYSHDVADSKGDGREGLASSDIQWSLQGGTWYMWF